MARAPRRAPIRPRRRRLRRRAPAPDSQQLAGIKQGVGRAVVQAFGGAVARRGRRRGGKRGGKMGYHPCHFDAFHMAHLPLPRPTGPYTIIRTTQLVTSDAPLMIFGPVFEGSSGRWTNILGYGCLDLGKTWGTANNAYRYAFENMNNASWKAAQICPAAYSVQLMNPGALQSTSGIVYGGRVRTAWRLTEHTADGGNTSAQQLISYNMPRLMAAAKLAFRGVQVDAVPFNMSRLADFTLQQEFNPGTQAIAADGADFSGFNPQFYYNPDKLALQYLVCCEWRVRFDPSNPAQASHVQHTHAAESIWMQALHAAEALGNGVVDIADKVAQTGNAVFGASASAYRASRGVRALTAGMGQLALA